MPRGPRTSASGARIGGGPSSSSASWDPSKAANGFLYLSGTSLGADASTITTWANRAALGGTANDFVKDGATAAPLVQALTVNGKAGVKTAHFVKAASRYLTTAARAAMANVPTSVEMWMVVKVDSGARPMALGYLSGANQAGGYVELYPYTDAPTPHIYETFATTGNVRYDTGAPAVNIDQWVVYRIVANASGGTWTSYFTNTVQYTTTAGTLGFPAGGTLQLSPALGRGDAAGTGYFLEGNMAMVFLGGILSAADVAHMNRYVNATFGFQIGVSVLAFFGDSQTAGSGAAPAPTDWPKAILYQTTPSPTKIIDAVGGWTTANIIATYLPYVAQIANFQHGTAFVWAGTNNLFLNTSDGATAAAELATICATLVTAGWRRIFLLNCLPRTQVATPGTYVAQAAILNGLIAAAGTSVIVPFDVAAMFPNSDDLTYYRADKVHLNDTANGLLATALLALM